MKKASRSAMQKWRRSTSKAMRSIPNGITPSSHGATKPQVEALILPRRLSCARNRSFSVFSTIVYLLSALENDSRSVDWFVTELCHSRESGNPEPWYVQPSLDARFRGHDTDVSESSRLSPEWDAFPSRIYLWRRLFCAWSLRRHDPSASAGQPPASAMTSRGPRWVPLAVCPALDQQIPGKPAHRHARPSHRHSRGQEGLARPDHPFLSTC